MYLSIAIILLLLFIGNIELNPGPGDLNPCFHCNFQARTATEHIYHQQLHSDTFNFQFRCPLPPCQFSYDSFRSVQAHLSHHSTANIHEVVSQADGKLIPCALCQETVSSNRAYCKHLKEHVKNGTTISCPYLSCSRSNEFTSLSVFNTHLAQCHPGWLQDYGIFLKRPRNEQQADLHVPHVETYDVDNDDTKLSPSSDHDDVSDSDSSCRSSVSDGEFTCDHDNVAFIAHFYATLEGKKIVPSTTVDSLATKLAILSELLQVKLKRDLKRALTQAGLSDNTIQSVIGACLSMDPLYNAHHLHAPGDTLLTSTRRESYYKRHFKHQDFIEINLKKNPRDTEDKVHYVDVTETLQIMLNDPTVKKAVRESFSAPDSDGSLLRDYTDWSGFPNSSTPKKTD